jgi:hypothetical protein
MILKNIFAEKMAFLIQNKDKLCKNLIITLVFEKNAIFRRQLAKLAENSDHNIDPCSLKNNRPSLRAIILTEGVVVFSIANFAWG